MSSEWLWDEFFDLAEVQNIGDVSELRLFAVEPNDLYAITGQYNNPPTELPPLPFYQCWFEAPDHKSGLIDIASTKNPLTDKLTFHAILICGSHDFGYAVGFFGKSSPQVKCVDYSLRMYITPQLEVTWQFKEARNDETDAHIPNFLWALSELSTAGGIHFVNEIPPRPTRRRYKRAGKQCPPRQVLIIGNPNRPSNSTGDVNVDWSCRWWVRGHWRHLKNKKIWIKAYVKGPADKPWRDPPPKYLLAGK
jgi:hypothetical protein